MFHSHSSPIPIHPNLKHPSLLCANIFSSNHKLTSNKVNSDFSCHSQSDLNYSNKINGVVNCILEISQVNQIICEGRQSISQKRVKKNMKRCGPSASRYQMPPVFGYRDHDLRLPRAPAFSFGSRTTADAMQGKDKSPGPATYATADKTRFGRTSSKFIGFNSRKDKRQADESPGPNHYYNDTRTGQRPPAYTFGFRRNENSESGEC